MAGGCAWACAWDCTEACACCAAARPGLGLGGMPLLSAVLAAPAATVAAFAAMPAALAATSCVSLWPSADCASLAFMMRA